jgi:hypothetical protein
MSDIFSSYICIVHVCIGQINEKTKYFFFFFFYEHLFLLGKIKNYIDDQY